MEKEINHREVTVSAGCPIAGSVVCTRIGGGVSEDLGNEVGIACEATRMEKSVEVGRGERGVGRDHLWVLEDDRGRGGVLAMDGLAESNHAGQGWIGEGGENVAWTGVLDEWDKVDGRGEVGLGQEDGEGKRVLLGEGMGQRVMATEVGVGERGESIGVTPGVDGTDDERIVERVRGKASVVDKWLEERSGQGADERRVGEIEIETGVVEKSGESGLVV